MNRAGEVVLRMGRLLLVLLSTIVLAQVCGVQAPVRGQPPAESPPSAQRQYRAAAVLHNQKVFDLAADEWQAFLKKHPKDPLAGHAQHYLGVCSFHLKKYPEAIAAFEQVLANHPNFELLDETHFNLGLTRFNQAQGGDRGVLARAELGLRALLEKFPDSKYAPDALYYQAEALYGLGKKTEAAASYDQFLKKFPEHALRPKALYGLGVALEETGSTAEAGKRYQDFLEAFPKNELATDVRVRRGDTLVAEGQHAAAEPLFAAAAVAQDFRDADYALRRQADCRYAMKRYREAATLYIQLVSRFSKSQHVAEATLAAGKSYFFAGELADADKWLEQSQAANGPQAVEAVHWLARSHLKQGRPQEALTLVETALPLAAESPLLADLKLDRADALYALPERRKEAIAAFAQVAVDHPEHRVAPEAAYMAGYAALGVGEYDVALPHAESFLAKFGEHELAADVMQIAAESHMQKRNYAEAAAAFDGLVASHASRPEAQQWIVRGGLCRMLQNQYAEVIATLLPKLPQLAATNLAEAQLLVGRSHFELKQYPAAVQALEASLAADADWPRRDETLLALARAQRRAGDPSAAIATAEKLIGEFSDSRLLDRAHLYLGEFRSAAGHLDTAADAYRRLLETWPDSPLIPHALSGLGWTHYGRDDFRAASDIWTRLIEQHAGHELAARTHYARAEARRKLDAYAGAIDDVAVYLKSQPAGEAKSDALLVRGLCEVGLKKYDAAAATFEEILQIAPEYPARDRVLNELAWTRHAQRQKPEAAALFQRLIAEHPQSPLAAEAQYMVGEFRYEQKQYAQAAAAYEAAGRLAGRSDLGEKAAYKRSWAYYQQNDYSKAAESFEQLVSEYPDGASAADGLAMAGHALFAQHKYAEALAMLTTPAVEKLSSKRLGAMTLLHAGQAAGQSGQWQQSLDLLEQCLTRYPDSDYRDEARYEKARAKQELGQLDEAHRLYVAVADETRTEVGARARFMAGEILFLKKDYGGAIRAFYKVMYNYGGAKAPEPLHKWQADATFEAARCFEIRKQIPQARKLYRELIERYPQSDKISDAKQKLQSLGG